MALRPKSSSFHNAHAGQQILHPASTESHEDFPVPPAKRLRTAGKTADSLAFGDESLSNRSVSPLRIIRTEVPDSEGDDEEETWDRDLNQSCTQLETSLLSVQTDTEAIEAYEAYKASQSEVSSIQCPLNRHSWSKGRSSIYVDAFNLALDTVLNEEPHLFSEAEKNLFEQWRSLPYESQYLYVRLFLRKTSAWHRIAKLGYYSDIADLSAAVLDLQQDRTLPATDGELQMNPGEVPPQEGASLSSSFKFAECSSDHITTLDEASSLLLLDELKALAKGAKIGGKNKKELLHNLRRTSGQQAGLAFKRFDTDDSTVSADPSGEVPLIENLEPGVNEAVIPSVKINRDAHFTQKILDQTGKCIRLSIGPLKVFERVHLVFYRSTEWTEKSLTTLILAGIARRNFPNYVVSRSSSIFESRELLLEFEAGLRTQFRVDNILEFNGAPGRKELNEIRSIFEEIYPRWKALLAKEQDKEDRIYESGEGAYLRRFSPAWVYTRILHKALLPFARFKEYRREHEVICELLDQRLFHAARRGAWYQRKALLEEHYLHAFFRDDKGMGKEAWKKHWKRIALRTCEVALEDRGCHVIYQYDLQKRIRKLEKHLRVPLREQHDFGHVQLGKAEERTVEGIKIAQDRTFNGLSSVRKNTAVSSIRRPSIAGADATGTADLTGPGNAGSKTVWLDELDTGESVSVEAMCLSYYRKKLGYKGYHSEGGILRMLFGLLFMDVLFDTYVPNVFQTPYQTCPLDLHTDAFYGARLSEINARVNQIGNGEAEQIVRQVWQDHYDRGTCVIGVRWDEYELQDLLEIVRCFEGGALGVVMRVLAQEYAARGSGVPDLFLWKVREDEEGGGGEVMFSEVKSENDRLSDTQRLWISVLLGAGVKVELCHAVAREIRTA